MTVECVHNFVCKTHKTINPTDGRPEALVEHAYPQRERGGISPGDEAAALKASFVEE
jgi:hypothetical protein